LVPGGAFQRGGGAGACGVAGRQRDRAAAEDKGLGARDARDHGRDGGPPRVDQAVPSQAVGVPGTALKKEKISNALYQSHIAKIDQLILSVDNVYEIQNQYFFYSPRNG